MSLIHTRKEILKRQVLDSFELFFKLDPPERTSKYIYGKHTLDLIDISQQAFRRLEQGISSYIIVNMPARHGKSDIISRRFPVWALLNNPRLQIMMGCANASLAIDMSYDSRKCFEKFCKSYKTANEKDFNRASSWRTIQGGGMYASGLGGRVAGKGADICIIDDYLGSREDADSEVMRNKIWNGFNDDFMLRLAPVHIVFIVATRWHEDDLVGRTLEKNNPSHDKYDPDFRKFKLIKYPAQNEDGTFLFPERFSDEFYRNQRASLGTYSWNCMAMQDPKPRVGNILKAERCQRVDKIEMLPEMDWHLGVDLAHSDDTGKGDPDYTVVTMACFYEGKIYVKGVWRFRKTALERDNLIINIVKTNISLDEFTDLVVEQVGASKDAFIYIKRQLEDHIIVRKYINRWGKRRHASIMEPIFELGNVIIERAEWNDKWISELQAFPGGSHDDQMDSVFIAINKELLKNNYRFSMDKEGEDTQDKESEESEDVREDKEDSEENDMDDYFE